MRFFKNKQIPRSAEDEVALVRLTAVAIRSEAGHPTDPMTQMSPARPTAPDASELSQ
jgi:hypothetical protein